MGAPVAEWRNVSGDHGACYPPLAFFNASGSIFDLFGVMSYVVFGGIHCVAWNFAAHSERVQWLWRAASLAVSAAPLLSLFIGLPKEAGSRRLEMLRLFIMAVTCGLFLAARGVLLVLPFYELVYLPADAYKTVSWENFVPHIG